MLPLRADASFNCALVLHHVFQERGELLRFLAKRRRPEVNRTHGNEMKEKELRPGGGFCRSCRSPPPVQGVLVKAAVAEIRRARQRIYRQLPPPA
jgi:hypothetical protein